MKAAPVPVAKGSDDLGEGVKGQSNRLIAGFPRNIFRYSVAWVPVGVEPSFCLLVTGGMANFEYHGQTCGSQTPGDKLRGSRGKQPRSYAKAPKCCPNEKGASFDDNSALGLEAATG